MSLLQTQTIQSNDYTNKSELVSPPVLPAIDIEHSELVLHDDDGNSSSTTQLEELSGYDGSYANICPAAINVENSNDVIIGPVTQFHGNVTIYQNVNGPQAIDNNTTTHSDNNGKLVKSESTSSDSSQIANNPSIKTLLKSNNIKFILLGLFLLLLGVIVIVCVMFLTPLNHTHHSSPPEAHSPPTESPNSSPGHPGPGTIIDRDQWGGRPPKYTKPLAHPTPLVIISHTATQFCDTLETCSNQVSSIQSYHVSRDSPDVGYNFLIGGDANVYVGRGWDTVNFHTNISIGICFIGNYVYDSLTPDMIQSALNLMEEGVNKGKLARNYTLVAHNQTYATQSPGPNVYRVIKFWPHFSTKLVL